MEKKVQVYNVIPQKLKTEIEKLGLSKTMRNKAMKLVCLIIKKGMENNHNLDAYVPMPAKYLEKIFNKEYHTDFFNLLKSSGIIKYTNSYKVTTDTETGYPKGYRINEDYLNGEFVSISYEEKRWEEYNSDELTIKQDFFYENPEKRKLLVGNSLSLSSTNSPYTTNLSHSPFHICTRLLKKSLLLNDLSSLYFDDSRLYKALGDKLNSITNFSFKVDREIEANFFEVFNRFTRKPEKMTRAKALRYCRVHGVTLIQDKMNYYIDDLDRYVHKKKENVTLNYKLVIKKLEKKIFYASRSETAGRLDHNLTSISKEFMEVIKEDNDLIEIDMANSQFAIHAHWLKEEGLCEKHADVQTYYDISADGILYEEVAKIINATRKVGKITMMELAFSKERNNTSAKKQFGKNFPNVTAQICNFKKSEGNYKLFSIELQKREAKIFVDNLYPNIKELGLFCLTKHDSLIVKRKDRDVVLKVVNAYFDHIDFKCTLAIK